MARIKCLKDEYGVIREAARILPDETLKLAFLDALAELEDNDCYVKKSFPKTRLHRVTGIKQAVFGATSTRSRAGDSMSSSAATHASTSRTSSRGRSTTT